MTSRKLRSRWCSSGFGDPVAATQDVIPVTSTTAGRSGGRHMHSWGPLPSSLNPGCHPELPRRFGARFFVAVSSWPRALSRFGYVERCNRLGGPEGRACRLLEVSLPPDRRVASGAAPRSRGTWLAHGPVRHRRPPRPEVSCARGSLPSDVPHIRCAPAHLLLDGSARIRRNDLTS